RVLRGDRPRGGGRGALAAVHGPGAAARVGGVRWIAARSGSLGGGGHHVAGGRAREPGVPRLRVAERVRRRGGGCLGLLLRRVSADGGGGGPAGRGPGHGARVGVRLRRDRVGRGRAVVVLAGSVARRRARDPGRAWSGGPRHADPVLPGGRRGARVDTGGGGDRGDGRAAVR